MRRREFITLLCGATAAWPLAARAQQQGKIPRIGIIDDQPMWNAFREGLRDLSYLEGQNIAFESHRRRRAPRPKLFDISPIFTSEKVTPTVSRENDEKSGLLYAQIGRFQNRAASRGACAPVTRRYV